MPDRGGIAGPGPIRTCLPVPDLPHQVVPAPRPPRSAPDARLKLEALRLHFYFLEDLPRKVGRP